MLQGVQIFQKRKSHGPCDWNENGNNPATVIARHLYDPSICCHLRINKRETAFKKKKKNKCLRIQT